MQIQINAPHGLPDPLILLIESSIENELTLHAQKLTRVEVHIQDQNAQKGGVDTRCLIEARPRGLTPLTADHRGKSAEDAFHGALEKLGRVLEHRFGKLTSKNRGE